MIYILFTTELFCVMSDDRITAISPNHINGDIEHIYYPNFTEEINKKMQVPKRIKVNGDNEDDVTLGNGPEDEKFVMNVPERILVGDNPERDFIAIPSVHKYSLTSSCFGLKPKSSNSTSSNHERNATSLDAKLRCDRPLLSRSKRPQSQTSGQEQCIGTKKAAVEESHQHVIIPPDLGLFRVQTPPRVISLAEHYFPAVDDLPSPIPVDDLPEAPVVIGANGPRSIIDADVKRRIDLDQPLREGSALLTDEIAHLRRQLAKLNRRVMMIETENLVRQQYERIVCGIGIAYIIWKALLWLRN